MLLLQNKISIPQTPPNMPTPKTLVRDSLLAMRPGECFIISKPCGSVRGSVSRMVAAGALDGAWSVWPVDKVSCRVACHTHETARAWDEKSPGSVIILRKVEAVKAA